MKSWVISSSIRTGLMAKIHLLRDIALSNSLPWRAVIGPFLLTQLGHWDKESEGCNMRLA